MVVVVVVVVEVAAGAEEEEGSFTLMQQTFPGEFLFVYQHVG